VLAPSDLRKQEFLLSADRFPRPWAHDFQKLRRWLHQNPTIRRQRQRSSSDSSTLVVESCRGPWLLVCVLDAGTGQVLRADASTRRGPSDPDTQLLLAGLERQLEGASLQDGAEHAVQRLEYELRWHDSPPPVPGIVHPEHAAPVFEELRQLVRAAYGKYLAKTGRAPTSNRTDRGAVFGSAAWLQTPQSDRAGLLRARLQVVASRFGLGTDALRVAEWRGRHKLFVAVHASVPAETRPRLMSAVEADLRRELDARFEVFLHSAADRNVKRTRRHAVPLDGGGP
jgi:hypothetical protein